MIDSDCLACSSIIRSPDTGREWYNEPLESIGSNVVVPAVGPVTVGHILVLPTSHVPGTASLPAEEFRSLWSAVTVATSRIKAVWRAAYVFEHGGSTYHPCRSSCFEHAHVHVVPGELEDPDLPFAPVSLNALRERMGSRRSYLLWGPLGKLRVGPDPRESQYMRRHVLRNTERRDEWDYAVFPRWEDVKSTISCYLKYSEPATQPHQESRVSQGRGRHWPGANLR
jgi:diadenosine tetraphosphate (Ap4A) HIT family hydrolase